MKTIRIESVGFSLDFTVCVVDVDASALPERWCDFVRSNGKRVLRAEIPVRGERMPSKKAIIKAARDAIAGYERMVARDKRQRGMLAIAASYAGMEIPS